MAGLLMGRGYRAAEDGREAARAVAVGAAGTRAVSGPPRAAGPIVGRTCDGPAHWEWAGPSVTGCRISLR
ncbi:hypothetical protein AV521_25335 [Streptomyces sp. IMTB 2501]|nr:hypothetical protein AV521_25335 [Streptomyces sp. IMTB 2501]